MYCYISRIIKKKDNISVLFAGMITGSIIVSGSANWTQFIICAVLCNMHFTFARIKIFHPEFTLKYQLGVKATLSKHTIITPRDFHRWQDFESLCVALWVTILEFYSHFSLVFVAIVCLHHSGLTMCSGTIKCRAVVNFVKYKGKPYLPPSPGTRFTSFWITENWEFCNKLFSTPRWSESVHNVKSQAEKSVYCQSLQPARYRSGCNPWVMPVLHISTVTSVGTPLGRHWLNTGAVLLFSAGKQSTFVYCQASVQHWISTGAVSTFSVDKQTTFE